MQRLWCSIVFIFVTGCASWIQANRNFEHPVAPVPVAWFRNQPSEFTGAPIRAGYSEADITPSEDQWLAGFAVGRKSGHVMHPLRAQCLALEDERGEKIMVVAMDLIGVLPDFVDAVLAQVRSWPKDRILFSASHTHSGPDTYGIWGDGPIAIPLTDGKDAKYIRSMQKNIALAIEAAVQGLGKAQIRFACGTAPAGLGKGRKDNDADQTISVLQAGIGGSTVTLVNYALHPDVVKGKFITPDFVHFMRQKFEAEYGGRMVFVNGAVGGIQPKRGNPRLPDPLQKNWIRAQEIGDRLAEEVINILENPIVPERAPISVKKEPLHVFVENSRFRLAMTLNLMPAIVDADHRGITNVYYVAIGPAEILTAPGELFPERWEKIKPRLRGNPKFLFGLTNVALGYIMSRRDFFSGNHVYHTTMSVGQEIGEELLRVYERLLRSEQQHKNATDAK